MLARCLAAASLLAAAWGCPGGDEEESDQPQFACRYDQHSFTLCSDGSRSSTTESRCTPVGSEAACTSRTTSSTNCTTNCCTDSTYSNVRFSPGSC